MTVTSEVIDKDQGFAEVNPDALDIADMDDWGLSILDPRAEVANVTSADTHALSTPLPSTDINTVGASAEQIPEILSSSDTSLERTSVEGSDTPLDPLTKEIYKALMPFSKEKQDHYLDLISNALSPQTGELVYQLSQLNSADQERTIRDLEDALTALDDTLESTQTLSPAALSPLLDREESLETLPSTAPKPFLLLGKYMEILQDGAQFYGVTEKGRRIYIKGADLLRAYDHDPFSKKAIASLLTEEHDRNEESLVSSLHTDETVLAQEQDLQPIEVTGTDIKAPEVDPAVNIIQPQPANVHSSQPVETGSYIGRIAKRLRKFVTSEQTRRVTLRAVAAIGAVAVLGVGIKGITMDRNAGTAPNYEAGAAVSASICNYAGRIVVCPQSTTPNHMPSTPTVPASFDVNTAHVSVSARAPHSGTLYTGKHRLIATQVTVPEGGSFWGLTRLANSPSVTDTEVTRLANQALRGADLTAYQAKHGGVQPGEQITIYVQK